ncbi:MAG: glycosyltransferase [Steroidobacteraceae bacterium]
MIARSARSAPDVVLFLSSLVGGGAERVFVDLANEFSARGLHVDIVLASAEGPYLQYVSSAVRVVDLKASRILRALLPLVRYLRAERPAAMLSALDHANVVAVLARRLAGGTTRCVISMRSVPTEVYRRADSGGSRLLLRFMKVVYHFADAIVANSHAVALDLSRLLGISVDEIHVIHNPLNLARIEEESRAPLEHEWFGDGAPPVVLGVGSLAPLKDFETLIRAFAIVRQRHACRLVILGEGPDRKKLEAVGRGIGVANHILMPGFVPNPFAWMRRARVFVSSSLTEGFPNALMQALALGLPVVSTNSVGGSAELLENGRWGTLVPVGRPGAMAAAIGDCLDAGPNPDLRRRAADFSHERIASRYLEVLLPWENPA